MKLDRIITVIGIGINLIGLIIIFSHTWAGIAMLVLGVALVAFSMWIIFNRSELSVKTVEYTYKMEDTSGKLCKVLRRAELRSWTRSRTLLEAKPLSSTGKYQNFESNLEGVCKLIPQGGDYVLQNHLNRPLPFGKLVVWELRYDGIDSFYEDVESVALTCLEKVKYGKQTVIFHPYRVPKKISKIILSKGKDQNPSTDEDIPSGSNTVEWIVRPQIGDKYILEWKWPDR